MWPLNFNTHTVTTLRPLWLSVSALPPSSEKPGATCVVAIRKWLCSLSREVTGSATTTGITSAVKMRAFMLSYKIIYLLCHILLQSELMLTLTTKKFWFLDLPIREESLFDFSPCCLREWNWIGVACARDQEMVFQGFKEVFRTLTTELL